ncbi:Marginal zone B- and B1-cell-specific protein [Armadillidium vulgare]|nr:Marginal zone B- and B1-cell-specific protein [Armadillidium vulgare]
MKKYFALIFLLPFIKFSKMEDILHADEASLKCDVCKIVSEKFASSFKKAEIEAGNKDLNEDEYIEAAESTCDEDWSGYGVMRINGVQRLISKNDELGTRGRIVFDHIWERRLQDFCDELLSEAPDEKTVYGLWKSDSSSLENYFCHGEGVFQACVTDKDFGPWPGDDYDDYDDFDYVHDEF